MIIGKGFGSSVGEVKNMCIDQNHLCFRTEQGQEPTLFSHIAREVKSKTHHYYQVLIDSRDCPFIRAQTEAVTFLGNQENSRSKNKAFFRHFYQVGQEGCILNQLCISFDRSVCNSWIGLRCS